MDRKVFYVLLMFVALCCVGCQKVASIESAGEAKNSEQTVSSEKSVEKNPVVSSEVEKLLKMQDQLNELVKKADVGACKGLELPQYQKSCQVNILVNKAKDKKDMKVCDAASDEDIKRDCINIVKNKAK